MTTGNTPNKFRYEGNGVTDTFAFTGRIFSTEDLVIEIILRSDDSLVETLSASDYTVTINGLSSASVTVDAGKIPSTLQDIQLRRALEKDQNLRLPTGTVFPAASVEYAIDRVTAIVQDMQEEIDRSPKLETTSTASNVSIESPVANRALIWDATGENLINSATDFDDVAGDAAASAATASASASSASSSASAAAASAVSAAASAASLVGSSTTSVLIGTGSKAFTTQSGKTFSGQSVIIASAANTTNYMHGIVTAYSGTSLTVLVAAINGTGAFADWIISVSGVQGPTGATGPTGPGGAGSGDVTGPASSVADRIVLFNGTSGKIIKDSGIAVGTMAAQNSNGVTITGGTITGITDLAVADGGTGAATAADARTNLGLGNVQNVDQTNASNITSGTLDMDRIIVFGTPDGTKFLRDDGAVAAVTGPTTSGDVGTYRMMRYIGALALVNNATTTAASLDNMTFTTTGAAKAGLSSTTGTWKNMSGEQINQDEYGLFLRTV